jgi:hypothetical protein
VAELAALDQVRPPRTTDRVRAHVQEDESLQRWKQSLGINASGGGGVAGAKNVSICPGTRTAPRNRLSQSSTVAGLRT